MDTRRRPRSGAAGTQLGAWRAGEPCGGSEGTGAFKWLLASHLKKAALVANGRISAGFLPRKNSRGEGRRGRTRGPNWPTRRSTPCFGWVATRCAHEAGRCLSCGNRFECDNCYAACPEQAIIKLGPGRRYRVDYELCTGCAVCFEQCPCHAIEMIPEPAPAHIASQMTAR